MSSNNNNLPPQATEHYVKLDDQDQSGGVMYSSIDTTMSGSVYQQQQQQIDVGSSQTLPQGPPLVESTMMTSTTTTTPQQNQVPPPSRGILDTVNDSLNSLVSSMSISSQRPNNNAYLQPQYNSINSSVDNPQNVYEYTLDSGFLDCQLVHPTVLGQANWRVTFELIIQHKTIPNITQKINKNEIGGSATYRPDLKVHVTALDKTTTFSERIETLINSDPQKSLQNFFVYIIVKKTKVNLLDVQKTPIAYSPCFTLGDFFKTGTDQQQQPMYSFDLFKDQQLREHVGKLGVRLSISSYSDYQYITSLPSGFFASKAFTVPYQISGYSIKSQKVTTLLALTEKVKKWLNSHSSLIKVVDISSASDGKEQVQVVLYQKL